MTIIATTSNTTVIILPSQDPSPHPRDYTSHRQARGATLTRRLKTKMIVFCRRTNLMLLLRPRH
ncbi:hypothetical protein E2C01_000373 [Portunus trituberculatus]|uniref:Uncharacterized protein n=1 Tax=Portunus trituberculatus TaxID=210409 RepID=A0A5B7CH27_PORTR|nr:hypothetical protein [Portunus trituberculatus]